ncbi:MAG: OmpA family protein [Roseovarius sp.]
MTRRALKSTTALVLAVSLAVPHGALAQAENRAQPELKRQDGQPQAQGQQGAQGALSQEELQKQLEKQAEAQQKAAEKLIEQQKEAAKELVEQQQATAKEAQKALRKAQQDDVAKQSAEQQAAQAAESLTESLGASALTGQGQVQDRSQVTVTEEQARSSGEEFETGVSGLTQDQLIALQAAEDDDDDLVKTLGAAAVGALGGYFLGQQLSGGGQVVANTGDRVVVEEDGQYRVLRDDNALLRRPGSDVSTETYQDGSTRTVVVNNDGTRTVTIRAANGQVLRRTVVYPDGQEYVLIDETRDYQDVEVSQLARQNRAETYDYSNAEERALQAALAAQEAGDVDRAFSLAQVRNVGVVRDLVPVITLDAINFETNSAVIQPREAEALSDLGNAMLDAIERNPQSVFLVEGHTDTVGTAAYNLALSDRRAESVALALTEYFNVPPANMVVQGYGESDLKIEQRGDIRQNRRAAVRNITPLLNSGV